MTPYVSIITITMNHLKYITEMMNSLFTTGRPSVPFEVIIVDNCSSDSTAPLIRSHYPEVRIIQNTQIYGFAHNNNIGVQQATGKYILILNPDIVVKPSSIDKVHQFAKENPSCGVIAPKLLNPDGTLQYSGRCFLSLHIFFHRFLTMGNDASKNKNVTDYLMKNLPMDKPVDVDWCMGTALLLRRDFYNELKGFDVKFFLYIEDMDICYRCWNKGKPWLHLKSFIYFLIKNQFKAITRPIN